MELNTKSLIVKSNKLIEARYRLSVGEQRLIMLIASQIQPNDEDFKLYKVRLSDMADILGLKKSGSLYENAKTITKRLLSNVLSIHENKKLIQTHWFSSVIYHESSGIVELRFDPTLKPYLLQLKSHFTKYELLNVIHLKHTYSIRIYELLKQYERIGKRVFKIDELRDVLRIEKSEYQKIDHFHKRVIKPSYEELKEKNTDIYFEYAFIKESRRIVAIEFTILSRRFNQQKLFEEEPNSDSLDPTSPFPEHRKAIAELLLDRGLSPDSVMYCLAKYDDERILCNIEYFDKEHKANRIKENPTGFLFSAIQKDFAYISPAKKKELKKKSDAKRKQEEAQELKKALEEVNAAYEEVAGCAISDFLISTDLDEKKSLLAEYIDTLPDFFKDYYKSKESLGETSPGFRLFIGEKISKIGKIPSRDEFFINRIGKKASDIEEEVSQLESPQI